MGHSIFQHRDCSEQQMIWAAAAEGVCACRECGTSWVLTPYGWKVEGFTPAFQKKAKFRGHR